jgi:hypothetical protein
MCCDAVIFVGEIILSFIFTPQHSNGLAQVEAHQRSNSRVQTHSCYLYFVYPCNSRVHVWLLLELISLAKNAFRTTTHDHTLLLQDATDLAFSHDNDIL